MNGETREISVGRQGKRGTPRKQWVIKDEENNVKKLYKLTTKCRKKIHPTEGERKKEEESESVNRRT